MLVLGGCGQERTSAVKDLITCERVSKVIIADSNIKQAKELKAEVGSKKIAAIRLDVNGQKAPVKGMKGADVVANFVGPYYIYGVKVIRAAMEAGTDYVDTNDDYDATRDALALHKAAKKAGID